MSDTTGLHIGIIMDGNRRYAKQKGLLSGKGHEDGLEVFKSCVYTWAKEFPIKELTFYGFSLQNFQRSKLEVDFMMGLFEKALKQFIEENHADLQANGIQISFVGRRERFSERIQELMHKVEEQTKENKKLRVNVAIGYGGREEVLDAANKAVKDGKELSMEEFSKLMQVQSEPDLVIRTGGAQRTSNFLIWQTWYSEWFFLDKFWPEFSQEDLASVIEDFQSRQRRFGK